MQRFLVGILILVAVIATALWLSATPDIPRAELEAKYAKPPSQFVTLSDGTRAHYRIRGAGTAPTLLLLHGSNASLLTWEPWSKALSNSYRVVSVDLPGHGLTGATPQGDYSQQGMADFVLAFADKIGLHQFALAGNSMGGAVAARFAEEHPDRVSKLILVDAGGMKLPTGQPNGFVYRLARTPVVNQVLLYVTPRSLVVDGLNAAIVRKSIVTDAMIDSYWEFLRMAGSRAATLARYAGPSDDFVATHASRIHIPTLILWGAEDRVIPLASAYVWKEQVAGARLIVYPATGHIPMEEVPEQSVADVRAFLGGA